MTPKLAALKRYSIWLDGKKFDGMYERVDGVATDNRSPDDFADYYLASDVEALLSSHPDGALKRLIDAAEAYSADQSGATDKRCGLVQPITVAEGQELNDALGEARAALSSGNEGKWYEILDAAKGAAEVVLLPALREAFAVGAEWAVEVDFGEMGFVDADKAIKAETERRFPKEGER